MIVGLSKQRPSNSVHRQNRPALILSHHYEGLATAYLRIAGDQPPIQGLQMLPVLRSAHGEKTRQMVVLATHQPKYYRGRHRHRFNLELPDRVVFEKDELMSRFSTLR